MEFIQAANYTKGRLRKIRLIVMHSTESPNNAGSARAIANYFARGPGASSHYVCDLGETIQCVADTDTAWCAPNANADGLHIEQCGYAAWPRDQWLAGNPLAMLTTQAAKLVATKAAEYGIPLVGLTPAQIAGGASGIAQHIDITLAYPGTGSHWDCGPTYPEDVLLALAGGTLAPAGTPIAPTRRRHPVEFNLRLDTLGMPEQFPWEGFDGPCIAYDLPWAVEGMMLAIQPCNRWQSKFNMVLNDALKTGEGGKVINVPVRTAGPQVIVVPANVRVRAVAV